MIAQGSGSIINISSVAGLTGSAGTIAYTASKFAVRGMTKVAAVELAPFGVRVNSVHPGLIDTAMLREAFALESDENVAAARANVPNGRLATAADVARLVLYLASDDSAYSTGSEFVVDGGMTARL
jgi:3alpha(or 20beta)-hydroxysteroid dehydrogenase